MNYREARSAMFFAILCSIIFAFVAFDATVSFWGWSSINEDIEYYGSMGEDRIYEDLVDARRENYFNSSDPLRSWICTPSRSSLGDILVALLTIGVPLAIIIFNLKNVYDICYKAYKCARNRLQAGKKISISCAKLALYRANMIILFEGGEESKMYQEALILKNVLKKYLRTVKSKR